MDAKQLFTAGKLREAIDAQIAVVKAKPGDQSSRLFLFELMAFAGEFDRAQRQIDALRYDDIELESGVDSYRKLLASEAVRKRVFKEGLQPKFLGLGDGPPPEHMLLRVDAINKLLAGENSAAAELLAEAAEATPPAVGTLNEKPFELFRDADDLLGPVIEVMAKGDYYWISLEAIDVIALNPPRFPRDLIWAPGRLETQAGESGEIFLPALYPLTYEHVDDAVKFGRSTDWREIPDGPVLGAGLKTYLIDDDAIPLLDWRELRIKFELEIPADDSAAEPSSS